MSIVGAAFTKIEVGFVFGVLLVLGSLSKRVFGSLRLPLPVWYVSELWSRVDLVDQRLVFLDDLPLVNLVALRHLLLLRVHRLRLDTRYLRENLFGVVGHEPWLQRSRGGGSWLLQCFIFVRLLLSVRGSWSLLLLNSLRLCHLLLLRVLLILLSDVACLFLEL